MASLFTTLADINICGTVCVGNCGTCVQSNADLNAFFGLAAADAPSDIQIQVMTPMSQTNVLEAAEALDAIEEAQRSGEAFDYACECDECLYDDRDDYDDYDDNCGLSWNESGYFD